MLLWPQVGLAGPSRSQTASAFLYSDWLRIYLWSSDAVRMEQITPTIPLADRRLFGYLYDKYMLCMAWAAWAICAR